MLMYGICSSNIKKVKWESVKEMLKEFDADLYEAFVEDLDGDLSNSNMEDWFSKYENEGHFGIGAFLKDYIEFKEDIILIVKRIENGKQYICPPDFLGIKPKIA